jgi:hypothetical protein
MKGRIRGFIGDVLGAVALFGLVYAMAILAYGFGG